VMTTTMPFLWKNRHGTICFTGAQKATPRGQYVMPREDISDVDRFTEKQGQYLAYILGRLLQWVTPGLLI
jgi:hypothetical protein